MRLKKILNLVNDPDCDSDPEAESQTLNPNAKPWSAEAKLQPSFLECGVLANCFLRVQNESSFYSEQVSEKTCSFILSSDGVYKRNSFAFTLGGGFNPDYS